MDTTKLKPFDLEKALAGDPVVTREGTPVRIIYVPEKGTTPVLYIKQSGAHNFCAIDGMGGHPHCDIFMAPKKVTRWVNFYDGNMACHYPTKEAACIHASPDALAVAVPVEYEE